MSDFLNNVVAVTKPGIGNRVGNHVICFMERDERGMNFLATDEDGWWGKFTVQYQDELSDEQMMRVKQFVRGLENLPLPDLFRLEIHEVTREVRAVLRWPLYEDYFGHDDVRAAVSILFEYWTTIEPFIDELGANTDVDARIDRANEKLALLKTPQTNANEPSGSSD